MIDNVLKNKKFGVFGLGISGIATLYFLKNKGIDFVAFDDNTSQVEKVITTNSELESHFKNLDAKEWQELDYLVLSPGIPHSHKVVELASKNNAKIICDVELFYINNQNSFFIGITGTNGKSTTTALINHILKFNNVKVEMGGNIGLPVMGIEPSADCIYVFEMSSFQLDLIDKTRFNVAVIMNITPDHLDRHGNMENYINAKYRIFKNQQDADKAIVNSDLKHDSDAVTFSASKEANFLVRNNKLYFSNKAYELPVNLYLQGEHNQQNIAAAIASCYYAGLSIEKIISALSSFIGLKHRMQFVGEREGVVFVNDSKATNADSTSNALKTFSNIIWIVGGSAKAEGIEPLKKYFNKIKIALLIGKSQEDFAATCGEELEWVKCDTLQNAFNNAIEIAKEGDVILLSPACASYDQWKNYEERGDYFIDQVKRIL